MSENFDDFEDEEEKDDEKSPKKKKKEDRIIWSREPKFDIDIFDIDMLKNFELPDLEKIAEKLMKQLDFLHDKDNTKGPVVWGFSLSIGPNKKPIIRPFGNINPKQKEKIIQERREPLVDIINEEKEISIIAEIPGVTKSDINLKTTETLVSLSIDTPKRKYFKEIALPSEVIPHTAKAQYNNGILEIRIVKKSPAEEETPIPVD